MGVLLKMSKFKVGDRVVSNGTWLPKGTMYTIDKVHPYFGIGIDGHRGWFSEDQFTLVQEEVEPVKPRPHVDLIKAWAEDSSVKIQYKDLDGWLELDVPHWYHDVEYRIKPSEDKIEAIKAEIESLKNSVEVKLRVVGEYQEDIIDTSKTIAELEKQL